MTTEREDPFDQLIAACQIALGFVEERIDNANAAAARAEEARLKRLDQRRRIEAALTVLTDEKAPKPATVGKRGGNKIVWTPEMREAAAERMRNRNRTKTEAAEAPAPLDATALDVEPA